MKLSRLYTNNNLFKPLEFNPGLNVVLAEIRLPENKKKDTHNLGKTTLGRLLDFCFLAKMGHGFFLFKHKDLFENFVFYLELELSDASYLTIRRGVKKHSKISFKKHRDRYKEWTFLEDSDWDHLNVPFEKAQKILDSLLDLRGIKPWSYRKGLGYQLRSQNDFGNVFHLHKFKGKHSDWKPFLAHLLGFDASIIVNHYQKEEYLEKLKNEEATIKNELGGTIEDISKIEGLLLLKHEEEKKKRSLLNAFDFRTQDIEKTRRLVDQIDEKIAMLNAKRYSYELNRKKIRKALEEDLILFDPDEAQSLFEQAGVFFQGQIKKDFTQLIEFNRAITDERRSYLEEDLQEIEADLGTINTELDKLGKTRSETLGFLSDADVFSKYRSVSDELVSLRADITTLERQRQFLLRLKQYRTDIRNLTKTIQGLQEQVENDVEEQNANDKSLFSSIRLYFSEIVEQVIARQALLSVSPNQKGHLEFKVEILDGSGNTTSADLGYTYQKLLCIAFDLAVLRAHLKVGFPRFVFHDGVFESLDDRKKQNLLAVLRRYVTYGIQPVITLIDSDLPPRVKNDVPVFSEEEIILPLHDEDASGRLFKMKSW